MDDLQIGERQEIESNQTLRQGEEVKVEGKRLRVEAKKKLEIIQELRSKEDYHAEPVRIHFKSDWHRMNLKLKTMKIPLIDREEKFQRMIENLSDLISGSNDDDNDYEGEGENVEDDDEKDQVDKKAREFLDEVYKDPRGCINQFGVYRILFPKSFNFQKAEISGKDSRIELHNKYLRELKSLQGAALNDEEEEEEERREFLATRLKTWVIMIIGGGHFAGMVVLVLPKLKRVTFHFHTTRRKEGRSQSTHNTGGKGVAKSAGANLRRYNKQALEKDIPGLLETLNLSRNDPRTRSLPF
ncbi:hypothetical protein PPACK8108_LOCUS19346 [Phakopsora pachyrhizi]|uniref:VLRF1 domain-containing protein n=1 Tax=Phakopsora pachyrhizi TaxID=170000 RepID=A0AAV0BET2_PHAPC|nr:hypothetical protein PPACK8108_LOCUS19346 [Phakopsora pachyrhizi]